MGLFYCILHDSSLLHICLQKIEEFISEGIISIHKFLKYHVGKSIRKVYFEIIKLIKYRDLEER